MVGEFMYPYNEEMYLQTEMIFLEASLHLQLKDKSIRLCTSLEVLEQNIKPFNHQIYYEK